MDDQHLQVAIDAALAACKILVSSRDSMEVREKKLNDLVTNIDLASQRAIFEILQQAFPDEYVMGEEEGFDVRPNFDHSSTSNDLVWIADPLDGTLNFVHGLQGYCVSLALVRGNTIELGVIADPVCDELFVARRGNGATVSKLDGSQQRPLRHSGCLDIRLALVACSFPAGVKSDSMEVQQFCRVLERTQAIRRLGSCALNLCYVADGRLDGYWAQSVEVWDMAAGALMIKESGAVITNLQGAPLDLWKPKFCVSSTRELQDQLLDAISFAS